MKIRRQGNQLHITRGTDMDYPVLGIGAAVILLYLAPFVTSWLAAVSVLICGYRILRYNARVFAVDYCMLMPVSALTKINGGVALLIYLCLLAGIIYLFRGGFRASAPYLILVLLMNYLFLRMQMDINDFVLCFGQMFVLGVLVPEQDEKSAERAIKAFCWSLILSSCYAYVLRNTGPLRVVTGTADGNMWGTNVTRFCGLFSDPNYYSTFLIVAIALLLKLRDGGRIRSLWFIAGVLVLTAFGILTYSKMFFLMLVMLMLVYVVWQYWNKKVFRGVFLTAAAILALVVLLTMENSPFAVVLDRLTSARTLKELTTSRSSVLAVYIREITKSIPAFLFGKGLAADALYRDPHNLYVEIAYYVGVVGLILILSLYISITAYMVRRTRDFPRQNFIAKYLVLVSILGMYLSLQGMFMLYLYAVLFLGYLSVLLPPKSKPMQPSDGKSGNPVFKERKCL